MSLLVDLRNCSKDVKIGLFGCTCLRLMLENSINGFFIAAIPNVYHGVLLGIKVHGYMCLYYRSRSIVDHYFIKKSPNNPVY